MSYVCARIRSTGKAYSRITSHNIRFIPPGYLKTEPRSETYYCEMDGTRHIFSAQDAEKAREIVGLDLKKREARMREEYKKSHGRSMTKNFVPFIEGILAFSPEPFASESFDMEEWKGRCLDFAADLAKSQNARMVYISFHFDETTPHAHYMMENFDKNKKTTWQRTFGKQQCRELQDRAAEHFFEMGFSRGESKSITGNEHKNLIESHHIERQKTVAATVEMKLLLSQVESEINLQKQKLNELRAEIRSRGEERKNLIAERQNCISDAQERKKQYQKFDLETKIMKKNRDEIADQISKMDAARKDIQSQIRNGVAHVDVIREALDAIRDDPEGEGEYIAQSEDLRIIASALAHRLGHKAVADALKGIPLNELSLRDIAHNLQISMPDDQINARYLDASKCAPGEDAHKEIGHFDR